MKVRTRIPGIIIKDGKLLLVKGKSKYKEYWTPGGKVDEGESEEECLRRELNEELNVSLVSCKFFKEYRGESPYHKDTITISKVYIVTIEGEISPSFEIGGYVWMSREDFQNKKYPLVEITEKEIIPDLIRGKIF